LTRYPDRPRLLRWRVCAGGCSGDGARAPGVARLIAASTRRGPRPAVSFTSGSRWAFGIWSPCGGSSTGPTSAAICADQARLAASRRRTHSPSVPSYMVYAAISTKADVGMYLLHARRMKDTIPACRSGREVMDDRCSGTALFAAFLLGFLIPWNHLQMALGLCRSCSVVAHHNIVIPMPIGTIRQTYPTHPACITGLGRMGSICSAGRGTVELNLLPCLCRVGRGEADRTSSLPELACQAAGDGMRSTSDQRSVGRVKSDRWR